MYGGNAWTIFVATLIVTIILTNGTPISVTDCSSNPSGRLATLESVSIVQDDVRVPGNLSVFGSIKVLKRKIKPGFMLDVTVKIKVTPFYTITVLDESYNGCQYLTTYTGECPFEGNNKCRCPIKRGTLEIKTPYSFYISIPQQYALLLNNRLIMFNVQLRRKNKSKKEVGCADVQFYVNPYTQEVANEESL